MILFALVSLIFSRQNRVLVLLGSKADATAHSLFLEDLNRYATSVDTKYTTETSITLERFGELVYETVIIIAQKNTPFGTDSQKFTHYLDNGGNAIIFSYESGFSIQRDVFKHFSLTWQDSFTDIYNNKTVILRNIVAPAAIVSHPIKPLVYEGRFAVIDRPNDFRIPVVVGGLEHYLASLAKKNQFVANELVPIFCMQARNGGRVAFICSHKFATDNFFKQPVFLNADLTYTEAGGANGNRDLLVELIEWTTRYKSTLRVVNATHYDAVDQISPVQYRCKQNITVVAELAYTDRGEFVPYKGADVQVELFMLGTFVRRHMKLTAAGRFEETLMIPDRAGNYKVKVFTAKDGWFNAREEMAIAVRPIGIREREHFLPIAQPYAASVVSVMVATFLAAAHFLYHKPAN